ncbi:lytic transglycosylase domain-containing protein [Herbiconiux sp. CPCC 205763]|uniref:Lytic transglycosylase domain-containing protein n=1 Tax=Herbiconiux aconitum TaxID=2970913 RepID=A0ABT2GQX9_9MICO|nr:lytic transglycosylase domain-containing protein [Herbiconiux aconitum]MCS5718619.1 lytic transglycosylase domain-containing protein [Herbiconiux aconitum]
MAKHSLIEARTQTSTQVRGVGRRTTNLGRFSLQMLGLAAVTACAFVTVVAPNVGATATASSSFDGDFSEGQATAQTLSVNGTVSASVFRDAYGVTEAPKPVPVVIEAKADTGTSADTGCPDPDLAVADPAGAQVVAAALAAERGWTGAQFDALVALWSRESGWRVNALNSSSCAYGIPQALPGKKMGDVAPDWQTNPATQITWGLNYIQGRYGDPIAALAHSDAEHWY